MAYPETSNLGYVEPRDGDPADIQVINQYFTAKVDEDVYLNRCMIAPFYSNESGVVYNTGDIVQYNRVVYKCLEDGVTGNWDATKWEQTTVGQEVGQGGGGSAEVTKEASGNPIELTDAASAPMVKCVSEIQGSQDLHGYDKPWVGGAGKNKLPSCVDGTYASNGITITVTNNVWKVTGQMTTAQNTYIDVPLQSAMAISSGMYAKLRNTEAHSNTVIDFSGYTILTNAVNKIGQISNNLTHNAIRFFCNSSATESFNMTMQISIEADSSATDWTPYSNICPITAYTEGEIEVRGFNIWDEEHKNGYYSNAGVFVPNNSTMCNTNPISVLPNTEYYCKCGSYSISTFYYDKDMNFISSGYHIQNQRFTTPSNCYYMNFSNDYGSGITYNNDICFNISDTSRDGTYEPYISTTYTTTYPSAIYRGSEDVVNGTVGANSDGEMWVKEVFDGSSDEQWSFSVNAGFRNQNVAYMLFPAIATSQTPIANLFEGLSNRAYGDLNDWQCSSPISSGSEKYINFVVDKTLITSLSDWKTWLSNNNLEVAYKVQTPTTEDVTPTNLPIRTLSGYNHIESSTGDMEVEYITEEYQPIVDLIESNSGKHVYSTDEQVVGTWIDGKTIYEKTYTNATEQSVSYQTWTPTVISATDIDRIVNLFTTRDADGGTYIPVVTRKENGYVEIFAAVGWIYNNITIQYTKTSSNNRSLSKSAPIEEDLSSEDEKSENTVTEEVNEK